MSKNISFEKSSLDKTSASANMNSSKKITASILWGDEDHENKASTLVQDRTWSMTYEVRYCDVDFRFVAGNRETFLSGEPENNGKKLSQLALKKKYK